MDTPPNLRTRLSPCGKFRLDILPRETKAGCWNYLDIDVVDAHTDRVIAQTTRNYPTDSIVHFLRQNDRDYLLISENYHGGYGCIDLQTGQKVVFSPPPNSGEHWCWAQVSSHDPVSRQLVIAGCYWAAPYDLTTMDFSKPMEVPYPVLSVEPEPYEEDEEDPETP